jgi:hypothetical protein
MGLGWVLEVGGFGGLGTWGIIMLWSLEGGFILYLVLSEMQIICEVVMW